MILYLVNPASNLILSADHCPHAKFACVIPSDSPFGRRLMNRNQAVDRITVALYTSGLSRYNRKSLHSNIIVNSQFVSILLLERKSSVIPTPSVIISTNTPSLFKAYASPASGTNLIPWRRQMSHRQPCLSSRLARNGGIHGSLADLSELPDYTSKFIVNIRKRTLLPGHFHVYFSFD